MYLLVQVHGKYMIKKSSVLTYVLEFLSMYIVRTKVLMYLLPALLVMEIKIFFGLEFQDLSLKSDKYLILFIWRSNDQPEKSIANTRRCKNKVNIQKD